MPPIDTTALTAIFTWVWKQYGKAITDKTIKAGWERLRWEDRALAYAAKVQRLYGTMQILGQAKPVPLEGIYTAFSLLDRPTALSRYTVEEIQAEFVGRGSRYFHAQGDEEKRRDGLEIVKGGENLFILGKPGAGKTTFLKHIALRGVSGDLERVPIFVGLKQLSDSGLPVFDYIVGEFDVCDFPDAAAYLERLLREGKAIVLFDGLDEVNVADDERARLISDVENFTGKYDKCQRLITCRLAANDYLFQDYIYVEMADFNEDQIREFVAKWFSDDERRELFLSELRQSESKGLRELARVPLLLALLCLSFEETLRLSSRRAELYEEALDSLLKKWDSSRNIKRDEIYRELSLKRKEQMLAQVAAETFDRAEYFIPEKKLVRSFEEFLSLVPNEPAEVDGEAVLQAIVAQHGVFLEQARNVYSFAHLTFQEYFTARHVVDNEARGTLPRLIKHYADQRYREVFLMTAAQLADADALFDLFIERLAGDAQEHSAVAALLRQVALKASASYHVALNPTSVRSAYIYLAFSIASVKLNDYAKSRDSVNNLIHHHAFDISFALNLDLACALNRDFANSLAPLHEFDLNRTRFVMRTLAFDLPHDRARASVLRPSPHALLARDIALVSSWHQCNFGLKLWGNAQAQEQLVVVGDFLEVAAVKSRALGDSTMEAKLVALSARLNSLSTGMSPSIDKGLIAEFDAALESADLVFPTLDQEDWNFVGDYLVGNMLLLECLEQADVADRAAIKARLLLLPE